METKIKDGQKYLGLNAAKKQGGFIHDIWLAEKKNTKYGVKSIYVVELHVNSIEENTQYVIKLLYWSSLPIEKLQFKVDEYIEFYIVQKVDKWGLPEFHLDLLIQAAEDFITRKNDLTELLEAQQLLQHQINNEQNKNLF
jgi:hypothetical protein